MADVIRIPSKERWVDTNIIVKPGDSLTFHAQGIWWDAYIPCGADGYPASMFYALNRPPRILDEGRYFRLMGRVIALGQKPGEDDPAQTFVIGRRSQRRFDRGGKLYVFCNDRPGYYWNNWGSIDLTIERST